LQDVLQRCIIYEPPIDGRRFLLIPLSRTAVFAILILALFASGCLVQSRHKTRSFMSEEELQAVDEMYNPPQEEEEEAQEPEIEPFLEGFTGPAIRVNGFDIEAADIRRLYEYLASWKEADATRLKQEACEEYIQTYAALSHWPATVDTAIERLNEVREQVASGVDFAYLIVENSQEQRVEETGGNIGEIHHDTRNIPAILEMHAMTDPVDEIGEPFPTAFGWHLLDVTGRDEHDPDDPVAYARHLLLIHGLDEANTEVIRENLLRWTNLAEVELLADELKSIIPWFATEPEQTPAAEPIPE